MAVARAVVFISESPVGVREEDAHTTALSTTVPQKASTDQPAHARNHPLRARSRAAHLDGVEFMLKGGQMGPPDLFERMLRGN
jgi:hypothetical protein